MVACVELGRLAGHRRIRGIFLRITKGLIVRHGSGPAIACAQHQDERAQRDFFSFVHYTLGSYDLRHPVAGNILARRVPTVNTRKL